MSEKDSGDQDSGEKDGGPKITGGETIFSYTNFACDFDDTLPNR